LFGLVLGCGKNAGRRRKGILLAGMLVLMAVTLVGCGNDCDGDDSPCATTKKTSTGTPAGTYTITVASTGTGASAPTHSITETLVVQ
jgi:ABC-type glycerol-3-phosphate transport system substrate-binding protein